MDSGGGGGSGDAVRRSVAAEGKDQTHKRHSISLAIFAFVGTPFFFTPCACFDVQHSSMCVPLDVLPCTYCDCVA